MVNVAGCRSAGRLQGAAFLGLYLLVHALVGCSGVGSKSISPDRFNYNAAIGQSSNEQMLLNLLRIRYKEVPVFLSVSSVLTQYSYGASAGIGGESGQGGIDSSYIGANAALRYSERPTITYTPLAGEEFSRKLISPLPDDRIFLLAQSGWPPQLLLGLCIEVISGLRNLPFNRAPTAKDLEQYRKFSEGVELMIKLSKLQLLELRRGMLSEGHLETVDHLIFSEIDNPSDQAAIDRLKALLNLSSTINHYRITQKFTHLEPDEVTLRMRSMVSLMGLFARGVDIPAEHLEQGWARERAPNFNSEIIYHLNVQHSTNRPTDAFVSVEYGGYWFFIAHSDIDSKEAFSLISYLYQMQAPQAPAAMPIITVPAG
jgi:hypothetical protein